MLPAIECLKMLIDKENGLGIPLKVAARFMDCHATTLGNYLHEGYTPSARLEKQIIEGLKKMADYFNMRLTQFNI